MKSISAKYRERFSLGVGFFAIIFFVSSGTFFGSELPPTTVPKLDFAPVPAEKSGLGHVLNSDAALGDVKYPWMSSLVDVNGDGHLEAIVYGHHGGGAAIWWGKGDGTFQLDANPYAHRWQYGGRDPVWIELQKPGHADGLGAEGTGIAGRVYLNDGTGIWKKSKFSVNSASYQILDLDGDGYHREVFLDTGVALALDPPFSKWATSDAAALKTTELWQAEKLVGWPEGVARGVGPSRSAYRNFCSVDLNGDHRNELIVHFRGSDGFDSKLLYTWVLQREGDQANSWVDITAKSGLPVEVGHWFYPEDLDVDGDLDLVNLFTGQWFANDGRGNFRAAATLVFNPESRLSGRPTNPWATDNETQWLDLDNNGFRDLVTATDHGSANGVYLNAGNGSFTEVTGIIGTRRNRKFGDVDHDGRLDMVSFDKKDRVTLHKNETPHAGIAIHLQPAVVSDGLLGAKIWVYRAGSLGDDKALLHYRQGFMERDCGRSQNLTPVIHVGIGQASEADIRVRFPSGKVREVRNVKAATQALVSEL